MKFTAYIINFCIVCMLFVACTDQNDNDGPISETELHPVQLNLNPRALPDNLECDLYIFKKKASDADYTLSEIVPFGNEDGKYLKFLNTELVSHDYRFFFIAADPANTEINLENNMGVSMPIDELWKNFRIVSKTAGLSDNLYYTVLDKTGASILSAGTINATLGRLVGQTTLDIFRIDGSLENPVPVQSTDVESVIDRVYQIDMQYTGLTKTIAFDDAGIAVEVEQWPDSYLQTILPTVGSEQKVTIPQEENGLKTSFQDMKGGVRILGACALPATGKIRIKATFHYYDTTPKSGANPNGEYTPDDFLTKELTLNIPQEGNTAGLLDVMSDYLTVSLAGIRYDRIIDIGVNGSYSFNTVWDFYE